MQGSFWQVCTFVVISMWNVSEHDVCILDLYRSTLHEYIFCFRVFFIRPEKYEMFIGKFIIQFISVPRTVWYQHIPEFLMTLKTVISDMSWIISCSQMWSCVFIVQIVFLNHVFQHHWHDMFYFVRSLNLCICLIWLCYKEEYIHIVSVMLSSNHRRKVKTNQTTMSLKGFY